MRRSILIVFFVAAFLGGCAARQQARPPASRTVAAGEEFDIRLPSDPGSGYRWQVARLDDKIVRLVDTRYQPGGAAPGGAGGTDVFTFVGVAPGRGLLELAYVRPWEKGVAPARKAEYSIDVL